MTLAVIRHMVDAGGTHTADRIYVWCPGCAAGWDGLGLNGLGVLSVEGRATEPIWTWDGSLETPTLSPSILTRCDWVVDGQKRQFVCHGYLEQGLWRFLGDSTHPLANQTGVPMVPLPDWVVRESEG